MDEKIDYEKCFNKIEWIQSEINDVDLCNEDIEIRTLLWGLRDRIEKRIKDTKNNSK